MIIGKFSREKQPEKMLDSGMTAYADEQGT